MTSRSTVADTAAVYDTFYIAGRFLILANYFSGSSESGCYCIPPSDRSGWEAPDEEGNQGCVPGPDQPTLLQCSQVRLNNTLKSLTCVQLYRMFNEF